MGEAELDVVRGHCEKLEGSLRLYYTIPASPLATPGRKKKRMVSGSEVVVPDSDDDDDDDVNKMVERRGSLTSFMGSIIEKVGMQNQPPASTMPQTYSSVPPQLSSLTPVPPPPTPDNNKAIKKMERRKSLTAYIEDMIDKIDDIGIMVDTKFALNLGDEKKDDTTEEIISFSSEEDDDDGKEEFFVCE